MHKPRNRWAARGWFGPGSRRYGRFHVFVMTGILLLFGSVSLLQLRLAEDGERIGAKDNASNTYSLDAMERDKMRLVREERDLDLEREYRIMLAEEGEGDTLTEEEANSYDELETESRLDNSEEDDEEEEDGGESLEEEPEVERDTEEEEDTQLYSFEGDVSEWLDKGDEFSGSIEMTEGGQKEKARQGNGEDTAEGLNFDSSSWNSRKENRRGLEDSKFRLGSRQEVLPTHTSSDNENQLEPKEAVQPRLGEEGKKSMTRERSSNGETSVVNQETQDPSWVQSLGQRGKDNYEQEVSNADEARHKKSAPGLYLRGARSGGSKEDFEVTDNVEHFSGVLKDSRLSRGVFSTDDEPVDDDTLRRMESMMDFEDVLMIKKSSSSELRSKSKLFDKDSKKSGLGRYAYDLLNPANNPLLQDPDTSEGGGLTKSDRVLLKARRRRFLEGENATNADRKLVTLSEETPRIIGSDEESSHNRIQETETEETGQSRLESPVKLLIEEGAVTNTDARPETVTSSTSVAKVAIYDKHRRKSSSGRGKGRASVRREMKGNNESQNQVSRKAGTQGHKLQTNGDTRRWGQFPGLHPKLSFTGFMEEFLLDEKCGLRVFMAWSTPPWSFTVRHQRVLESLLIFHPDACVVVFSESIQLTFFQSFVAEGYRVAVAMPQLQELLEDTPSEAFAEIYLNWRQVKLFSRHYTELLRLAALYKYGGIYLDMDMLVLKPLTSLQNTLGSEVLPDGHTRPNGAIMVFERFSPFLNACMAEFTATYDEKLVEWNGASLLERVVNGRLDELGANVQSSFSVREPSAFFPLSSTDISRYFSSPENETDRVEEDLLYDKILEESYTVHLWNPLTSNRVPEPGSLVQRLMERKCLRCMDVL
ncbi:hypothetical protein R1sor_024254 [Riccia sorocarpa]|uniref:Alpha 1,4-glycosyltransferase domain-containing protein n=1 Tax=Riccia sorocarpa TaxID=122646 RepID=A0ABD3GQ49_9MARC